MPGEMNARQVWKTQIGEGWVFRVLPIDAGWQASGNRLQRMNLLVDREQPAPSRTGGQSAAERLRAGTLNCLAKQVEPFVGRANRVIVDAWRA